MAKPEFYFTVPIHRHEAFDARMMLAGQTHGEAVSTLIERLTDALENPTPAELEIVESVVPEAKRPAPPSDIKAAHAAAQFKLLNVKLRRKLVALEAVVRKGDVADMIDFLEGHAEKPDIHEMSDFDRAHEFLLQCDEAVAKMEASIARSGEARQGEHLLVELERAEVARVELNNRILTEELEETKKDLAAMIEKEVQRGLEFVTKPEVSTESIVMTRDEAKRLDNGELYQMLAPGQSFREWMNARACQAPESLEALKDWFNKHTNCTGMGPEGPPVELGGVRYEVIVDDPLPPEILTPYECSRAEFDKYAAMDAPDLPESEQATLQVLLHRWEVAKYNGGSVEESTLGVCEENGELAEAAILLLGASTAAGRMAQCIVKRSHSQRGMEDDETYRKKMADAIADLNIYSIGAANKLRLDWWTIVNETAQEVMTRNRPGKEPVEPNVFINTIKVLDDPDRFALNVVEAFKNARSIGLCQADVSLGDEMRGKNAIGFEKGKCGIGIDPPREFCSMHEHERNCAQAGNSVIEPTPCKHPNTTLFLGGWDGSGKGTGKFCDDCHARVDEFVVSSGHTEPANIPPVIPPTRYIVDNREVTEEEWLASLKHCHECEEPLGKEYRGNVPNRGDICMGCAAMPTEPESKLTEGVLDRYIGQAADTIKEVEDQLSGKFTVHNEPLPPPDVYNSSVCRAAKLTEHAEHCCVLLREDIRAEGPGGPVHHWVEFRCLDCDKVVQVDLNEVPSGVGSLKAE